MPWDRREWPGNKFDDYPPFLRCRTEFLAFQRVVAVPADASSNKNALQLQEHILDERRLLMELDHPFILKLHDSFQDNRCSLRGKNASDRVAKLWNVVDKALSVAL